MVIWLIVGYIVMIILTTGVMIENRKNFEDCGASLLAGLVWPFTVSIAFIMFSAQGVNYVLKDVLKWL